MTAPIQLPDPIPIAQVTKRSDRFVCVPYKVKLLAGACVERQDMLATDPNRRGGDYLYCRGCKDGERIRTQIGAPPAEPEAPKPTHGPGVAYRMPNKPKARAPLLELPASPPSERPSEVRIRDVVSSLGMAEPERRRSAPRRRLRGRPRDPRNRRALTSLRLCASCGR